MSRLPIPAALLLAFTLVAAPALAQQLRDPTRPPAMLRPPADETKAPGGRGGLMLQSVLISPERRSAIIDGNLLTVGQSVSGFRVVLIEEGAVTLKGAQGTRRLQLFPEIEMKRSLTVRPQVPPTTGPGGGGAAGGAAEKKESG